MKRKLMLLKTGAWNIRALMDGAGSDNQREEQLYPEGRTAIFGRDLRRYNMGTSPLSKTPLQIKCR